MFLIHVQIYELENRLAKVEAKLKMLKYAKNKEEQTEKKKTIKDMVSRLNKDGQGCSKMQRRSRLGGWHGGQLNLFDGMVVYMHRFCCLILGG
jgi:hypothetical protein